MRNLTFREFEKIEDLIDLDSLTGNQEYSFRWFEGNIRFVMDSSEYAKVLRHYFGFNVVDEDGSEIGTETRPSWTEYFLGFAEAASVRAECTRRQVGAVVVKDKRVIGTGYNGAPKGAKKTCLTGDCPRASSGVEAMSSYDTGPGSCISIHAEANAIIDAGRRACKGAVLYITCEPCGGCLKLIRAAEIKKVVWPDGVLGKRDLYG